MSREFSLVLLGAGALSAGYLLAPDADAAVDAQADAVAAAQTGHPADTGSSHRRTGGHLFIFVHTGGYAGYSTPPGRSAASPGVARSGFGGTGRGVGGGAVGGGSAAS